MVELLSKGGLGKFKEGGFSKRSLTPFRAAFILDYELLSHISNYDYFQFSMEAVGFHHKLIIIDGRQICQVFIIIYHASTILNLDVLVQLR